ncbi:MAG: hypothetical protein AB7N76_14110 [Planctomycetota bacterium]
MKVSLQTRTPPLRCPGCHDDLLAACERCGTVQHLDCFGDLGCVTLGCEGEVTPRSAKPTPPPPSSTLDALGLSARRVGMFLLVAVLVAIAAPSLFESRRCRFSPIGGLRVIASAQALFREGDRDGDGRLDYGTLQQLAAARLVDEELGSGLKGDYEFQAAPGGDGRGSWWAIARPRDTSSGERSFFTNQSGVIWFSFGTIGICDVRSDCAPSPCWRQLGQ